MADPTRRRPAGQKSGASAARDYLNAHLFPGGDAGPGEHQERKSMLTAAAAGGAAVGKAAPADASFNHPDYWNERTGEFNRYDLFVDQRAFEAAQKKNPKLSAADFIASRVKPELSADQVQQALGDQATAEAVLQQAFVNQRVSEPHIQGMKHGAERVVKGFAQDLTGGKLADGLIEELTGIPATEFTARLEARYGKGSGEQIKTEVAQLLRDGKSEEALGTLGLAAEEIKTVFNDASSTAVRGFAQDLTGGQLADQAIEQLTGMPATEFTAKLEARYGKGSGDQLKTQVAQLLRDGKSEEALGQLGLAAEEIKNVIKPEADNFWSASEPMLQGLPVLKHAPRALLVGAAGAGIGAGSIALANHLMAQGQQQLDSNDYAAAMQSLAAYP